MMKFIDSKLHGIIDYIYVVFLLIAPALFNLNDFVSSYTYILAAIAFIVAILTNYEVGIFNVIPFPLHGIIELFYGILIVVSPWLLSFSENRVERNFYLVLGLLTLLIFTFTKFKEKPA